VKWYRKAAEQNDAAAQNALGDCYHEGKGAPKDYVEAYKWWSLASAQNHEHAKASVTKLEPQMSPQQIAEARNLAQAFKPKDAPLPEVEGPDRLVRHSLE
jgi:TPR repeat protein